MYNSQLDKKSALSTHQGVFRRQLSMWEAVALIVSTTIGAGILGIPYAIAKVGVGIGLLYIVGLGFLLIGLNLLLGEVATRTGENLQLPGLSHFYLGKTGKWLTTVLMFLSTFGILTVYIIGVGESLAVLLGGPSFFWSTVCFLVGTGLIIVGMHTIKKIELILTLGFLLVVLLIIGWSAPHVSFPNIQYYNLANLLFPYGVILLAFSSATSIPEAHSILANREKSFKKVIIISGLIAIAVYAAFAFMVVGVTGAGTTEIATIGLGSQLGEKMFLFGNIFAILAMGTSFLIIGLSVRDSMIWDYKIPRIPAALLTTCIPFAIFAFGVREFIEAMDFVGGVLVSLQMIIVVFVYWAAKHRRDLPRGKFGLHHTAFLVIILLFALIFGTLYSIGKMF